MSLEQTNQPLTLLGAFYDGKVLRSGLTDVTVTVGRVEDGAILVFEAPCTELALIPLYVYTVDASLSASAGSVIFRFHTDDATVDEQDAVGLVDVGAAGVDYLDAYISSMPALWPDPLMNLVPSAYPSGTAGAALGRIGVASISVVSPVAQTGFVQVIRGDAYKGEDGRAIEFVFTLTSGLPDLSGATAHFRVLGLDISGILTPISSSSFKVSFDLSSSETAALDPGSYLYQALVLQADNDPITFVQGQLLVLKAHS